MNRRKLLNTASNFALLALTGCSGARQLPKSSSSRFELFDVHVNVTNSSVRIVPHEQPTRAVLSSGVAVTTGLLTFDYGTTRVIELSITNTTVFTLGKTPDGYVTGLRVNIGNGTGNTGIISIVLKNGTPGGEANVRLVNTDGYNAQGRYFLDIPGEVPPGGKVKKLLTFDISPDVQSFAFSMMLESIGTTIPLLPTETSNVTSLIAGSFQNYGRVNGPGNIATFNVIEGVALDQTGAIYACDSGNNCIRRIDTNGNVSTISGSLLGAAGWNDGIGKFALYNWPRGICRGLDGAFYITDKFNHCIRRLSLVGKDPNDANNWVVSTISGRPVPGYIDGTGLVAQLNIPMTIVCVNQNTYYVNDAHNNRIRVLRFLGGDANSKTNWSLDTYSNTNVYTYNIALDPNGNLLINNFWKWDSVGTGWPSYTQIQRLRPDGSLDTIANPALISSSKYSFLTGCLSVDGAGDIYIPATTHYPSSSSNLSKVVWSDFMLLKVRPTNVTNPIITVMNPTTGKGFVSATEVSNSGNLMYYSQGQLWRTQRNL